MLRKCIRFSFVCLVMLVFGFCAQEKQHQEDRIISAIRDSLAMNQSPKGKLTPDTFFVDKAYLGMPFSVLKASYPGLVFIQEDPEVYDVDGNKKGMLLKKAGFPYLFVWSEPGKDSIEGIMILTKEIAIDSNVQIGMTALDLLKKYNGLQLNIDPRHQQIEYATIPDSLRFRLEFFTSESLRVGEYKDNQFVKLNRPEARAVRIRVE
jgi:hypothetical protein